MTATPPDIFRSYNREDAGETTSLANPKVIA